MSDIKPLVVVFDDKFNGIYSGGKWTAWNMCYVPSKIFGDEKECADFFAKENLIFGRGETPEEAIEDLKHRLVYGVHMSKEYIKEVSESTEDEEEEKMEPTSVWRIENIDDIWITQDVDGMSLMLKNKDDLTKIVMTGDAIDNFNDKFVISPQADMIEYAKDMRKLEKENKELKAKSKDISDDNASLLETNKKLKEENERNKENLNSQHEMIRELIQKNFKLKLHNFEVNNKKYDGKIMEEILKRNFGRYSLDEEDNKMKATSVQNIKNVKDICFSIEVDEIEMESKLTIVASTNDDIFAFEFEGSDLLQSCKKVGLFTGWENDETIKRKNREINELNQKLYQVERDKERLTDRYKDLEKHYNELSDEHAALRNKKIDQMRSNELLKRRNQQLKEEKEKIYKDEIVALIHGVKYTVEGLVDRILELEKLKTPTIENFADEQPSSRRDILKAAEKCVCGQREQDYGTPESNFKIIADLWNDYLGLAENGDGVPIFSIKNITPTDVSMMMALLKIARIKNGGGSGDSFVDLAGYAACGGEIWADKKSQKDQN